MCIGRSKREHYTVELRSERGRLCSITRDDELVPEEDRPVTIFVAAGWEGAMGVNQNNGYLR
jgi:hypothetical protein